MTMSTGPIGGAPAPSIIVAPRMISRSNGPSPSPGLRSGPGWIERCGGCVCANAITQPRAYIKTTSHDLCDRRDIAVLPSCLLLMFNAWLAGQRMYSFALRGKGEKRSSPVEKFLHLQVD